MVKHPENRNPPYSASSVTSYPGPHEKINQILHSRVRRNRMHGRSIDT